MINWITRTDDLTGHKYGGLAVITGLPNDHEIEKLIEVVNNAESVQVELEPSTLSALRFMQGRYCSIDLLLKNLVQETDDGPVFTEFNPWDLSESLRDDDCAGHLPCIANNTLISKVVFAMF